MSTIIIERMARRTDCELKQDMDRMMNDSRRFCTATISPNENVYYFHYQKNARAFCNRKLVEATKLYEHMKKNHPQACSTFFDENTKCLHKWQLYNSFLQETLEFYNYIDDKLLNGFSDCIMYENYEDQSDDDDSEEEYGDSGSGSGSQGGSDEEEEEEDKCAKRKAVEDTDAADAAEESPNKKQKTAQI